MYTPRRLKITLNGEPFRTVECRDCRSVEKCAGADNCVMRNYVNRKTSETTMATTVAIAQELINMDVSTTTGDDYTKAVTMCSRAIRLNTHKFAHHKYRMKNHTK